MLHQKFLLLFQILVLNQVNAYKLPPDYRPSVNLKPVSPFQDSESKGTDESTKSFIKTIIIVQLIINYFPIIWLAAWYLWDKYINTGKKLVLLDRVKINHWIQIAQSPLAISIWSYFYQKKRQRIQRATGQRDEWDIEEKESDYDKNVSNNPKQKYAKQVTAETIPNSLKAIDLKSGIGSFESGFNPKAELGNIVKSLEENTKSQNTQHTHEKYCKDDLVDSNSEFKTTSIEEIGQMPLDELDLAESQNFDDLKKANKIIIKNST